MLQALQQQQVIDTVYQFLWMVYGLVVRAFGLEYEGREFESRSMHLRPETKLWRQEALSL